MLGLYRTIFLFHFLNICVECVIPALSVAKLNRKLVARKRQDTLDLCRMFSAENEKVESLSHSRHKRVKRETPYPNIDDTEVESLNHSRHKRVKRGTPSPNVDDAARVENIVDKLYDEAQENGERVTYRQKIIPTTTSAKALKESGRRFDFAPHFLEGPQPAKLKRKPPDGEAKIPWHKHWKHGIVPYFIDPRTYDSFLAEKITKAFDYFERSTCIRLQRLRERPTDKESLQRVEWLYITNPSGTRQCVHSNEYKPNIGVQMVVFGYDCMSQGEIVHEVMHVLGFSHEHVREDRDHYISVLWDNIKPGYKKYFEMRRLSPLISHLPYDYGSVLHYPQRAFSKNGKFTIMAEPGVKFGQREALSELDVEKVSLIFGNECMNRNKLYLLTTCPIVISADKTKKNLTQDEITEYFKDRLWPYGIVNYKLKDNMEFSIEERENIDAVIRHIEKETCIEFRDLSEKKKEDEDPTTKEPDNDPENDSPNDNENEIDTNNEKQTKTDSESAVGGNEVIVENKTGDEDGSKELIVVDTDTNNTDDGRRKGDKSKPVKSPTTKVQQKPTPSAAVVTGAGRKRVRRAAMPLSPSRRHADDVLVLKRSPESGCNCPPPGKPGATKDLFINADCFNSVNDLLHLFVHVLGLDHQHNMYDRDAYLAINWTIASEELKKEMETLLPPAASVGFQYDYQSVTHYPWLHIKNGVTNVMYPIWNDGWAMGHWQGLSSVDVKKLNLLYFDQCQARKKHIARRANSLVYRN